MIERIERNLRNDSGETNGQKMRDVMNKSVIDFRFNLRQIPNRNRRILLHLHRFTFLFGFFCIFNGILSDEMKIRGVNDSEFDNFF